MLLDLLFPRRCVGCGRDGAWACSACAGQLAVGRKLEKIGENKWALYPFELPIIRELLHALKYSAVHEAAEVLRQLTGQWSEAEDLRQSLGLSDKSVFVPVPISPSRRKERGYNQAELLAKAFAGWLGVGINSQLLRKKRAKSLVGKTAEERRQQAAEAFSLAEIAVADDEFIIIDDVLTTGSTAEACRNMVQLLSSRPVKVLVIAHKH